MYNTRNVYKKDFEITKCWKNINHVIMFRTICFIDLDRYIEIRISYNYNAVKITFRSHIIILHNTYYARICRYIRVTILLLRFYI